jgi:hypothetical protein
MFANASWKALDIATVGALQSGLPAKSSLRFQPVCYKLLPLRGTLLYSRSSQPFVFLAGQQAKLPGVLRAIFRAELVDAAVGAVRSRELRMNCHAPGVACCRPPAGALLALRTDRKVSIPIDLERTQIVAALQLATMPILLHWADKGDPMLPSYSRALFGFRRRNCPPADAQVGASVWRVLPGICDMGCIRSECCRGVNISDQMWDTGRADFC